jgi:hypothetical protein
MSREETKLSLFEAAIGGAEDQTVAILAVGESEEWLRKGNSLPTEGGVMFVSIQDVTFDLLNRVCPSVVISPALSARFDCIDLAQILYSLGYRGRYRAVSRELPNPTMIEREINQICPGLDFGILVAS